MSEPNNCSLTTAQFSRERKDSEAREQSQEKKKKARGEE